jgi:hypothetical protein
VFDPEYNVDVEDGTELYVMKDNSLLGFEYDFALLDEWMVLLF